MSFEWIPTTLGEFSPFQYGKSLPQRDRKNGPIPVISSAGITDFHDTPLVDCGGVVIGRKGTVGKITYSPGPFWPIDTAFFVVDRPEIRDIRFVYYLLKTIGLDKMNTDSAVPGLNRDNAHATQIFAPPLKEQKRIADVLAQFDDRITLLRETNKTLESIAQTIFKSWFVEFDPVRAKMEGRQPEGMDEKTAALFPDELEESELGMIPKGWKVVRLDEILTLSYGKALRSTERVLGEVPVYGSGGITGYHNQSIVEGPSIIIGRKGTVGSLYWEDSPFFPIDTVFYVKTALSLSFCFYLLQRIKLSDMNTDAAVPGLNRNNVYRLKVAIPDPLILNSFDDVVTLIRQKILKNNQASKTLMSMRDLLLPRLITGQLRISDSTEVEDLTTT